MSGNYDRKDRLYKQAKEEGYRSRAAYKLMELDAKHRILKNSTRVVDLGCFPGGWLQVAAEKVGPKGKVVGIDLQKVEPVAAGISGSALAPVTILLGDINDLATREAIGQALGGKAHLVLSDMSPKLTGIRIRDIVQSAELLEAAFQFSREFLQSGGNFIAKAFPGPDVDEVFKRYTKDFMRLARTQLKSSRNTSDELYIIGQNFRYSSGEHAKVGNQHAAPDKGD